MIWQEISSRRLKANGSVFESFIVPWHRYLLYDTVIILQVYCIFLFLCAASLFGTIIAQVNEIVAQMTTKKKDLDKILEIYLSVHPRHVFLDRNMA